MKNDLMSMFEDLDRQTNKSRSDIVKAPFAYPGSKRRMIDKIIPHLPYTNTYVEAFGGSGSILLGRARSKVEVLNDRYMGIVAFYKCLRSRTDELIKRLEWCLHSREEFLIAKNWENQDDDLERAALWFQMMQHSFAGKGKNWGRTIKCGNSQGLKVQSKLNSFPAIAKRLQNVQIENLDWYNCIQDYDTPDTVFYLDPPYLGTFQSYSHNKIDNDRLIETIFSCEGFVALSGYSNPFFEDRPWDDRFEWEVKANIQGIGKHTASDHGQERGHVTEVLWIKEAK